MRLILILTIFLWGEFLYGQLTKIEKVYDSEWTIGKEDVQLKIYRFDSIAAAKKYVDQELLRLSVSPKELLYTDRNAYYFNHSSRRTTLRVRQGRFYAKIYTKKKKTAFDIASVFLSRLPDYLSYPPPPPPPPPPPIEPEVEEIFKVVEVFPSFSASCDSLKDNALRIGCTKKLVEEYLFELIEYEYPEIIKVDKNITETIVVSYTVESTGEIRNVKILKAVNQQLGEMVKTALEKIDLRPEWTPYKARGRNISVEILQEIKFQ